MKQLSRELQTFILLNEQLQELGFFNKLFVYGPIRLIALSISKKFNHEVYDHFLKFLIKLDDAIVTINAETKFPVQINRVDIGEAINSSMDSAKDVRKSEEFFTSIMKVINLCMIGVIKSVIDEMYANSFDIKNITSLQSLKTSKYSSIAMESTRVLLSDYLTLLSNKPFGFSVISSLKRFYADTNFIHQFTSQLEDEMVDYIHTKMSTSNRTLSVLNGQY